MMFAKTVCNSPGSYVEVVPFGLLATLKYNSDGILEKIFQGFEESEGSELSQKFYVNARKYVPVTISVKGGTTWVKGVFYSNTPSNACGALPECTYSDYIQQMEEGYEFTFYAGDAHSLATRLSGVLSVRNWLNVCKFNTLPGSVVPGDFNQSTIDMMLSRSQYPFRYPNISAFILFNSDKSWYEPSGLIQCTVKTVSPVYVDSMGYYKCTVKTDLDVLTLDYSTVVEHDIHTASCITYCTVGHKVEIMSVRKTDSKKRDSYPSTLVCPSCGKLIRIAPGPVQCSDENCLSRLYPTVCKMIKTLKLPDISFDEYKVAVEKKEILCLTDVLLLDKYKDSVPVPATLCDAIKACVPVTVCADESFFTKFANSCNNSVETALYYITHPIQIQNDMNIESLQGRRFVQWLADPANALTIQTMFTYVDVKQRSAKFEGAPIFRGKRFMLTGKFTHGTHQDVKCILESYSGKLTDDVSTCDALIVGSIKEGIDSKLVNEARFSSVPVFNEADFFSWNGIDSDLRSNLL